MAHCTNLGVPAVLHQCIPDRFWWDEKEEYSPDEPDAVRKLQSHIRTKTFFDP